MGVFKKHSFLGFIMKMSKLVQHTPAASFLLWLPDRVGSRELFLWGQSPQPPPCTLSETLLLSMVQTHSWKYLYLLKQKVRRVTGQKFSNNKAQWQPCLYSDPSLICKISGTVLYFRRDGPGKDVIEVKWTYRINCLILGKDAARSALLVSVQNITQLWVFTCISCM